MPRSGAGEEAESGEAVVVGAGAGEVGRMVDSSQADDRRMIRLVRERRLLYARNNIPVASYYSQVKTLWEEVAADMGWTVADVRRKWSHIRNSYSRHLRNEMAGARTGRGRQVSRWYLADELEFLREHMATDTRTSPYSYAPTFLEVDMGEQHTLAPDPPDVKPFLHSPWMALAPAPPAPVKPEPSEDSCASSHAFGPDENSSYFQFFRGIHNDYQELSARRRRQFKRQCLAALHDLLDDQDAQRPPSPSSHSSAAASLLFYNQSMAMNLTNSAHGSEDERDQSVCVVEKVENYSVLPND